MIQASPPPTVIQSGRPVHRRHLLQTLTIALLLAITGSGYLFLSSDRQASAATATRRAAPPAVAPTDPIIGQWKNNGGQVIFEVRPDGGTYFVKGLACRIGKIAAKDLVKTGDGEYTVSNGSFDEGACDPKSFTKNYKLSLVDGQVVLPNGNKWTRVPPAPILPNDPIIGAWNAADGSRSHHVLRNGITRVTTDKVACRVGTFDSIDLRKVAEGVYRVRDGRYDSNAACSPSSYAPNFTLILTPEGLRAGSPTGRLWTRAPAPAVNPQAGTYVRMRFEPLVGAVRVPVRCILAFREKDAEGKVDTFLNSLGLTTPGVYNLTPQGLTSLDKAFLEARPDSDPTEELYAPLRVAVDKAAAGAPDQPVEIDTEADSDYFGGLCLRMA